MSEHEIQPVTMSKVNQDPDKIRIVQTKMLS